MRPFLAIGVPLKKQKPCAGSINAPNDSRIYRDLSKIGGEAAYGDWENALAVLSAATGFRGLEDSTVTQFAGDKRVVK